MCSCLWYEKIQLDGSKTKKLCLSFRNGMYVVWKTFLPSISIIKRVREMISNEKERQSSLHHIHGQREERNAVKYDEQW